MSSQFDRLSPGDLVLITGVSGLIGSGTAEEALRQGFRVRGVSRDPAKLVEMVEKFDSQFGKGQFESVQVADMTKEEVFAPHLAGVAGVLHVATDTSFSPNAREVIDIAIQGTLGLMREAAKVPSVKSFVLTSSRVAAFDPPSSYDRSLVVTKDTYYDGVVPRALAATPEDPAAPVLAYAASKVEAEKAAWEYYKAAKPQYAFNTILPDYVIGNPSNPRKGNYSTYSMFMQFYTESRYEPGMLFHGFTSPPSFFVDLRDVAAVHVIALAASGAKDERIFAITDLWSAREAGDAILKADPDWKAPQEVQQAGRRSNIKVPNERFRELIKEYAGRPPFELDEMVAEVVKNKRL